MKVMVTGATGFIGKELIKRLNEMGHEIVVLTRNSDSKRMQNPSLSLDASAVIGYSRPSLDCTAQRSTCRGYLKLGAQPSFDGY